MRWQQQRQRWWLRCADCRIRSCKMPSARANEQQKMVQATSCLIPPRCSHHCALAALDGAPVEGCSQGRAALLLGDGQCKAQMRAWRIAKLQPAQH